MLMYPKHVRKALKSLIKHKLCINKVSTKHAIVLLEYGLHGSLPSSLYNEAIAVDICNVRYLPPNDVKVKDIIKALQYSQTIDSRLRNAVLIHRKELLTSGLRVVKLMLESNLLTSDDVKWILKEKLAPATYMLKIDPKIAAPYIKLSKDELVDVLTNVPQDVWEYLYENLDLDLESILYASDMFNAPPIHKSLSKLTSESLAIELVKKYPFTNVITFINAKIKFSDNFILKMHELVNIHFPKLLYAVNDVLLLLCKHDDLIKRYGIKCTAMFSIPIPINIDDLTEDEQMFIEENIAFYDVNCRNFALKFRTKIMETCNKVITMKSRDMALNKSMSLRASIRSLKSKSSIRRVTTNVTNVKNTIEDILMHIDTSKKRQKVKLSDVEKILSIFRLDPCAARNVMLSMANTKTKIMALNVIKKWKSHTLSLTSTFTNFGGLITMDMLDTISTKILHNYRNLFIKITKYNNITDISKCTCDKCDNVVHKTLRSTDVVIDAETTDDELMMCLFDLVRLAIHGQVNPNLIGISGWGPLCNSLMGQRIINIDIKKIVETEVVLIEQNIMLSGNELVDCLISIYDSPSYVMTNNIFTNQLNDTHTKVVLFFNILIEYMLAFAILRVDVLQQTSNIREFIFKIVNTVLEASGIYFCQMRISEYIEDELFMLIEKGTTPSHITHLMLRVISIILEDINDRTD
ncbi:virulence protein [Hypsugopox virus]|nr:virulence protein [Hypsugopox virus]